MGVSPSASATTIKKSFRQLALKYHPDQNPNNKQAEALFKDVNEAYDILSDETSRKEYDALFSEKFPTPPLAKQKASPPSVGKNLVYHLNLTLEEAFSGGSKVIRYVRSNAGVRETATLTIDYPRGVRDEQKLRVRGAGESLSPQQSPGDLLVTLHVLPHPLFSLRGSDIWLTVPLSPLDFILRQCVVPTLNGLHAINPSDFPSSFASEIRIKNKGFPLPEGSSSFGDLVLRFSVEVPQQINENLKHTLVEVKKQLPQTEAQVLFEKYLRS